MAQTNILPRSPDNRPLIAPPPARGPERVRWFDSLDGAISIDILRLRLDLAAAGLTPNAVEDLLADYCDWFARKIVATFDAFAAEIIAAAS